MVLTCDIKVGILYTQSNEDKQVNTFSIEQSMDSESPRTEYDHLGTMVCFHRRYSLGDKHGLSLPDALKLENSKDVVSLPLYLYDHSGITISHAPFACPWDSGKVGFIYVTKENIRKEYGVKAVTKATREKVIKVLIGEIREYNSYLTGDVWDVVERDENGFVVNSNCGIIGRAYAEEELAYMQEVLEESIAQQG